MAVFGPQRWQREFGPDGFLYASAGDGSPPSPPDMFNSGQDISDFRASILRIDVDREADGKPYAIPPDNPFVATAGAAPEVFAFGLRNPWRMSFDRATGDLWLGDVGWQMQEMVYRIERGGNYGWSIMEGPQVVRPQVKLGPASITPPVVAHERADAASVTGGFVYHGSRLPELSGHYIYGDYVTGKLWAFRQDPGSREVTGHIELADTSVAIICFHEDPEGEISFLDYNAGTIHQLEPNASVNDVNRFPRKLSETGLFASTADHVVADGVVSFSVNAEAWADGTTSERFLAVPGDGSIRMRTPRERVPVDWGSFPADTVLAKTISLELEPGNPASRRRLETQILHRTTENWRENQAEWKGYTYVWNESQTDAELADRGGIDLKLQVADTAEPSSHAERIYHVSSRAECYQCHNPWAGYRLAFTPAQLDKTHQYGRSTENQLKVFERLGLATVEEPANNIGFAAQGESAELRDGPLANPHDASADLDRRARSYLHVNCAHCHRFGGGGTSVMDLRYEVPIGDMRLLNVTPTQGRFGMSNGHIVLAGHPEQSVLLFRTSKLGRGRMPYIGSQRIDERGIQLLYDWISGMESRPSDATETGEPLEPLASENPEAFATATANLLATTSGAMQALQSLNTGSLSKARGDLLVAAARAHARSEVRDLFERFVPASQRVQRLGASVKAEQILSLPANASAGRKLVMDASSSQCLNCHRIEASGKSLGPDLTTIGKTRERHDILESILTPSRRIDPKYAAYVVETTAGRLHAGLLVERTTAGVTLRDAQDKTVRIPTNEIELLSLQTKSFMPELLFQDMTAQQLADVVAFLASLK